MRHAHVVHVTAFALRVLAIASAAEAAEFEVETSPSWTAAIERLAADDFDAVLVDGDAAPAAPADIALVTERVALVVIVVEPDAEHAAGWLRQGADDVVGRAEMAGAAGWRRVRFAVERRRRRDGRVNAYSTDLHTGLPHRQQLVEHLSQLLALREREPAPMAVLAFRIEGLRPRQGAPEASDDETLRRKIAVRLRAGVRASDVVAAIDDDTFAVLLGSVLATADAHRVVAKLLAVLLAPFTIGAVDRAVAVACGVAHYPQDGQDAERLLRRALALAAAAPATGSAGPTIGLGADGAERAAANDER